MNSLLSKASPSATHLIRMDHTHVLATFHQYEIDAPPRTKQALVHAVCLALEIHAQLEEEIFYPAMQASDSELVAKNIPEHDEMRRMISELRPGDPSSSAYDDGFMRLMREVIHHVADEETILLPDAERVLGPERLGELGARMTRRRIELSAPRAGEMAMNTLRGMPTSSIVMAAGAVLAGTYILTHALRRPHWIR